MSRSGHLLTALFAIAVSSVAGAQTPASARLIFPGGSGRTGVFRLAADSLDNQVQAELLDSQGRRVNPARCVPAWKSADPSVLAIRRAFEGSVWVRPERDGITQLTATFPCNSALTLTAPVVVGSAAIEKPFAAPGNGAQFYPSSLKVTPPGHANVSGGKVYIRPIDASTQFVAAVRNGAGGLITPDEFPMKWSVSNPSILKIEKAYDHTAFFAPAGTGTTTVKFDVEGLSLSFDVTVQDAFPPSKDDPETIAALITKASPTMMSRVGANLPVTVTPAPRLPVTVQPTPGQVASRPSAVDSIDTFRTGPTTIASPTRAATTSGASTGLSTASGPSSISSTPTGTATPPLASGSRPPAQLTPDPAAVHSTAFTAISGYSNIQLKWTGPAGAVGYRLSREGWDPVAKKWVLEAGAVLPSKVSSDAIADQSDLITTTEYLDSNLNPAIQYVYVLSTFFKGAGGQYYYADRASEPRATATPKNSAGLSWLPSDWQAAPNLTKVEIISQTPGGVSTATVRVEWQPKGGAAGYIVSLRQSNSAGKADSKVCGSTPRPIQVAPTRPGNWFLTLGSGVTHTLRVELSDNSIKEGLLEAYPGGCIQVWAVYPNKVNPATGTPDVMDAFYTEITGPGPESRFLVKSDAIVSADAAAMFFAPGLLSPWQIAPQSSIRRW